MPDSLENFYKPFSFIDGLITKTNPGDGTIAGIDYDVLKQYITKGSVYWGDATAIDAINSMLKINSIVIKKGNRGLANSISSQITGIFPCGFIVRCETDLLEHKAQLISDDIVGKGTREELLHYAAQTLTKHAAQALTEPAP